MFTQLTLWEASEYCSKMNLSMIEIDSYFEIIEELQDFVAAMSI
jgi:hypothetical protein